MSECREAFERNECEKYGNNYDDMKKNWDWYESQYGWRYPEDSPRGLEWKAWDKAWLHQQSKVDELQVKLEQAYEDIETFATAHQRECEFKAQFAKEKNELQKRLDAVKQLIQVYKDEEKELEIKEWEQSTIYGRIAIELEQALKGGGE